MGAGNRSDSMKAIIYVCLAALFLGGVSWFANVHAAKFEAAMQDYEECMQERAGMTPSAFYQQFGYYPECY